VIIPDPGRKFGLFDFVECWEEVGLFDLEMGFESSCEIFENASPDGFCRNRRSFIRHLLAASRQDQRRVVVVGERLECFDPLQGVSRSQTPIRDANPRRQTSGYSAAPDGSTVGAPAGAVIS